MAWSPVSSTLSCVCATAIRAAAVEADTLKLLRHQALQEPTWRIHRHRVHGTNFYLQNLFLHFTDKFQIPSLHGQVGALLQRQPVLLLINKPLRRGRTTR